MMNACIIDEIRRITKQFNKNARRQGKTKEELEQFETTFSRSEETRLRLY